MIKTNTYFNEVMAWLEGPEDGRLPSEALVGLAHENHQLKQALEKCVVALEHVVHGPESAWNLWLYARDAAISQSRPLLDPPPPVEPQKEDV